MRRIELTTETQKTESISFETHPDRYKHWRLSMDGPVARLVMDVQEHEGAFQRTEEARTHSKSFYSG